MCAGLLERVPTAKSQFCDQAINDTIDNLEKYEDEHVFMESEAHRNAKRDDYIKHFIQVFVTICTAVIIILCIARYKNRRFNNTDIVANVDKKIADYLEMGHAWPGAHDNKDDSP